MRRWRSLQINALDIYTENFLVPGYVELTQDRMKSGCSQPNLNVTRIEWHLRCSKNIDMNNKGTGQQTLILPVLIFLVEPLVLNGYVLLVRMLNINFMWLCLNQAITFSKEIHIETFPGNWLSICIRANLNWNVYSSILKYKFTCSIRAVFVTK